MEDLITNRAERRRFAAMILLSMGEGAVLSKIMDAVDILWPITEYELGMIIGILAVVFYLINLCSVSRSNI